MDPIKAYLKDVRNIPLLTPEEEIELARRIKKGDKTAREKMIKSNLRLVISIAKRYVGLGVPLSDLIEEGNIGLMKGVEKFDPERGFRFSTYAAWWIKQGISRAVIDQGKLIRIPVYMNEEILKYKRAVEALTHRLKRKPRPAEIAKKLGIPVEKVKELENAITKMSSLDAPIGEDNEGRVKDIMEDERLIAPDEELEGFFNKERARAFLEMLEPRERKILEMRYGLIDGQPRTLAEIAEAVGVSRERVRQLEAATLKKIRKLVYQNEVPMTRRAPRPSVTKTVSATTVRRKRTVKKGRAATTTKKKTAKRK